MKKNRVERNIHRFGNIMMKQKNFDPDKELRHILFSFSGTIYDVIKRGLDNEGKDYKKGDIDEAFDTAYRELNELIALRIKQSKEENGIL